METTQSAPVAAKQSPINTGSHDFKHPSDPYSYGSADSLIAKGYPAKEIVETDTRLTLREVYEEIRRRENVVVMGDADAKYDWNMEYFGPMHGKDDHKWPDGDAIIVYPARGGSEGWTINVDVLRRQPDGSRKHECLLWGKTFASRDEIWASVRRISEYLDLI